MSHMSTVNLKATKLKKTNHISLPNASTPGVPSVILAEKDVVSKPM